GAAGGFCWSAVSKHVACVMLDRWKLFSTVTPCQLISRLLGRLFGSQWISNPCVTRVPMSAARSPLSPIVVKTLPPPVIRPESPGACVTTNLVPEIDPFWNNPASQVLSVSPESSVVQIVAPVLVLAS